MDRLAAMTAFVRVVEHGSFARAAERLSMSTSAVSRQVAELEAHLDARLLNRTTRRISLTEAGRSFFERSIQLLADLEEADDPVVEGSLRPKTLAEYIGQAEVKSNLSVLLQAAKGRERRRTTSSCTDRPAWARPRSRRSSPANSG